MFTNRRKKQISNQSPLGRKWYSLGGGSSYSSNSYSVRDSYTYNNTTKKRKRS